MKNLQIMGLIVQFSLFLGVYLGGSVAKLKQNHLWKNNRKYKNNILNAYFIIVMLTGVCMIPLIYSLKDISLLILLMPISICVFSSHLVLGKNIIYKIIIPAIPIILFQLTYLKVNLDIVLLLIVIATVVLSVFMYKNIFYQYQSMAPSLQTDNNNKMAFMTTGLNYSQMNKINGMLGLFLSKWILSGKKKVDWSILMPHTRLALLTLFYSLCLLLVMSMTDAKIQNMISVFPLMLLPNIFLGLVMESCHLMKQTRFYSHVFTGNKHKQLKNKILIAMDKNMLINAAVFVAMTVLVINVLSIGVPINALLLSMSVIIALSMAIYPLLMCLNWVNISMLLIIVLLIYGKTLYEIIKWVYANHQLALSPIYITAFLGMCLLLRISTQVIFWNRPMEALLKNR